MVKIVCDDDAVVVVAVTKLFIMIRSGSSIVVVTRKTTIGIREGNAVCDVTLSLSTRTRVTHDSTGGCGLRERVNSVVLVNDEDIDDVYDDDALS